MRRFLLKISEHRLTRNAAALTLMQVSNYIAPLLVLPYLTRTLGVDGFGAVMVTLAALQFAYVITDYGFSLSATRDIAMRSNERTYVARKIGAVWAAKLPLLGISMLGLLLAPLWVAPLKPYESFFAAAVPAAFAMAYQPIWLFLGIERMRNVTIYMVATKALYVFLVLMVVRSAEDAIWVIYCWGGAQIMGLTVAVYLVKVEGYSISWPRFSDCRHELLASAQFFWSRLSVTIYTSLNTIIIGSTGAAAAAHYSVCEQVFNAGKSVTAPINTALYPYMTKQKDWRLFSRLLSVISAILAIGCTAVAVIAGPLLGFVFGQEYASSASVLVVFCVVVFINYFGVSFGYAAFSALGRVRIANITVLAGAILQIAIVSGLYYTENVTPLTIALAVVATETLVMTLRVGLFIKYRKFEYIESKLND